MKLRFKTNTKNKTSHFHPLNRFATTNINHPLEPATGLLSESQDQKFRFRILICLISKKQTQLRWTVVRQLLPGDHLAEPLFNGRTRCHNEQAEEFLMDAFHKVTALTHIELSIARITGGSP